MRIRTNSTITILALLLSCVAIAACGDDDGGDGSGSVASPEGAATSSAEAALDIQTLADTPADEVALGSVSQMHAHLQTMSASSALPAGKSAFVAVQQAVFSPDCVSTDGDTTTYAGCEISSVTVNGTVGHSGDTVTIDLWVDVDTSAYDAGAYAPAGTPASAVTIDAVSVHEHGSLDFAGDAIVGVMNFDIDTTVTIDLGAMGGGGIPGVTGEGGETTATQTNSLSGDFDISLTDRCPTGGTLTVTSDSGLPTGDSSVTATYGPDCGGVAVE